MSDREQLEDEYRVRMSDSALELRRQVSACWHQSSAMLDRVNGAIALSDAGQGPPDEREMLKLWNEVSDLVDRANRVRSLWRDLNNSAQTWTVISRRPHYFADLAGGDR